MISLEDTEGLTASLEQDEDTVNLYRPPGAKWDDPEAEYYDAGNRLEYSNTPRLCFDCLVSTCVKGTIRCEPCAYKRSRRLG